ncbi:GNAT family N-acetyltransferase [Kitasatospora cinereorecta]|uniref:GNAT family N-acetyltransferase n=1 Tax=Kitasatospora cinereorecta TaxID=285560 RepID=A0ABW0V715_9ACTN
MLTLHLRPAVPDDLPTLVRWRAEAAEWIARVHGCTQWSRPMSRARRLALIEAGATVLAMLEPGGEPVASYTVRDVGSRRLWTDEERARPAHYLSRLVVDRRHTGLGIGGRLADWTRHGAALAGVPVVRINVAPDNPRLQAYYAARGWHRVGTVPTARAGALFEAPALDTPVPGIRPDR